MENYTTQKIVTSSGTILYLKRMPFNEGKKLLELHKEKEITWLSNPRCHSYYFLLKDNKVLQLSGLDLDYEGEINFPGPEAIIYEPYDAFSSYVQETYVIKKNYSEPPINRVVRLPGGLKIFYEFIGQEALSLLRAQSTPLSKLNNKFLTPENKVLVDKTFIGEVYKNEDEYTAVYNYKKRYSVIANNKVIGLYKGILTSGYCGLNPYGKEFLIHVDELAKKLPGLLEAPTNLFNFSVETLPAIDKYLYRNIITPNFQENVFSPLLAYMGKTFIANKGGNWEILHDEFNDVWLPDVKQDNGEMKMLYHPIYLILDPNEGQGIYIPLKSVYRHIESNPENW